MSPKYPVPCPTCREGADKSCRTLTTGRVTDTHPARIQAAYPDHSIAIWSADGEGLVHTYCRHHSPCRGNQFGADCKYSKRVTEATYDGPAFEQRKAGLIFTDHADGTHTWHYNDELAAV